MEIRPGPGVLNGNFLDFVVPDTPAGDHTFLFLLSRSLEGQLQSPDVAVEVACDV